MCLMDVNTGEFWICKIGMARLKIISIRLMCWSYYTEIPTVLAMNGIICSFQGILKRMGGIKQRKEMWAVQVDNNTEGDTYMKIYLRNTQTYNTYTYSSTHTHTHC